MKEEIKRIMQLVKDGKLSPEDAAELIEAFEDSEKTERVGGGNEETGARAETEEKEAEQDEEKVSSDPFKSFIGAIEKIGKDVAQSVNWQDVAGNLREGVGKAQDAFKKATEDARRGKGPFGTFFGSHETKTVELPFSIPKGKILRIEGEAGDVCVTGGADECRMIATATFRAHNDEEARSKAENYTPVIEESEQFVLIRQPEGSDFSVDLNIFVGDGVPVEVRLQSGDVQVFETKSSTRVVGRSGDVHLRGLDGTVDVSVYSGDVKVEDSKVSVMTVETKSGDVKVKGTHGVMNVRTASGNVNVKKGAGRTLSIEAASGDVTVEMAEPVMGAMNIRTVSGDARVFVPDGSDCHVMLSTLRGSVSSTLELTDLNQESLTITGKLGGGNGSIDISAVNGDVHLGMTDSA